jgi:hypothetical protein
VIKLTPILCSSDKAGLSSRKHQRAIDTALGVASIAALQLLQSSTRRWKHKPPFKIAKGNPTTITVDDDVFFYQDQGTKPHVIRPRKKRALFWPGAGHPVKRVNHPGTKAMHYMDTAQAAAQAMLPDEMDRQIARVRSGG